MPVDAIDRIIIIITEEKPMTDSEKKEESKVDCALKWLKTVDHWAIAGYENKLPRMYLVVAGLLVLFLIV